MSGGLPGPDGVAISSTAPGDAVARDLRVTRTRGDDLLRLRLRGPGHRRRVAALRSGGGGGGDRGRRRLPVRHHLLGLQLPALRRRGPCRPFRTDRGGLSLGEGAGVLVLETLEHAGARRRRASWPSSSGAGASCDASHMTAPHPEGVGAAPRLLRAPPRTPGSSATRSASSTPTAPALHSTTPRSARLSSGLWRTRARRMPVSATKSVVGHLLGSSGAIEAVATVLCLESERPTRRPETAPWTRPLRSISSWRARGRSPPDRGRRLHQPRLRRSKRRPRFASRTREQCDRGPRRDYRRRNVGELRAGPRALAEALRISAPPLRRVIARAGIHAAGGRASGRPVARARICQAGFSRGHGPSHEPSLRASQWPRRAWRSAPRVSRGRRMCETGSRARHRLRPRVLHREAVPRDPHRGAGDGLTVPVHRMRGQRARGPGCDRLRRHGPQRHGGAARSGRAVALGGRRGGGQRAGRAARLWASWTSCRPWRTPSSTGTAALARATPHGRPRSPRPFDRRRNGFVAAEGATVLVLEEERRPHERSAPAFARVRGLGGRPSIPARRASAGAPASSPCARASVACSTAPAFGPRDVSRSCLGASGSVAGDRLEASVLRAAFEESGFPRCSPPRASPENTAAVFLASLVLACAGTALRADRGLRRARPGARSHPPRGRGAARLRGRPARHEPGGGRRRRLGRPGGAVTRIAAAIPAYQAAPSVGDLVRRTRAIVP